MNVFTTARSTGRHRNRRVRHGRARPVPGRRLGAGRSERPGGRHAHAGAVPWQTDSYRLDVPWPRTWGPHTTYPHGRAPWSDCGNRQRTVRLSSAGGRHGGARSPETMVETAISHPPSDLGTAPSRTHGVAPGRDTLTSITLAACESTAGYGSAGCVVPPAGSPTRHRTGHADMGLLAGLLESLGILTRAKRLRTTGTPAPARRRWHTASDGRWLTGELVKLSGIWLPGD